MKTFFSFLSFSILFFTGLPCANAQRNVQVSDSLLADGTIAPMGQIYSGTEHLRNILNNKVTSTSVFVADQRRNEIQGSPYLNENWGKGKMVYNNEYYSNDLAFRYNILKNQLEIRFSNGETTAPYNARLMQFSVVLNRKIYLFKHFDVVGEGQDQFFEALYEGANIQFIKCYKKRFRKGEEGQGSFGTLVLDSYEDVEHYYIKTSPTAAFALIKLKKKNLLEAFPKQNDKLKKLLQEPEFNKLDESNIFKLLKKLENS
jgi:hypothetical protein